MKNLIVLLLIFPLFFNAQFRIDYKIAKIQNSRKISLNIDIINESSDKYIIPLDTTGFRVYYRDEPCKNFFYGGADVGLGLTLLFDDNGKYIDGQSSGGYLSPDLSDLENEKLNNYKKSLNFWKKKYHLKIDSVAEKNKYLFENLISIAPKQVFHIKKIIDPNRFNDDERLLLFNTYYLQPEKVYKISISHCIDKSIYANLTKEQKIMLKGYKFFTGTFFSKETEYSFSKEDDL